MKAFDHYPGSKDAAGAAERILSHFPAHSVYIETHLGNGACLRRKTPALRSIGIDIDPHVIERWRALNWPGLELIEADATEWLASADTIIPADALVYLDPPYPPDVRTKKKLYRHEMTLDDHRRLLDAVCAISCSVIISSYHNPLYAEMLAGWRTDSFQVMTRGGVRTEWLWIKQSIASFTDGSSSVGRDYRDRERIKRKVTRWKTNFAAMRRDERNAVLRALLSSYAEDDAAGIPVTDNENGHS